MVELHLMRRLSELGPAGLPDLILLEEGLPSSAPLFPNVLFVFFHNVHSDFGTTEAGGKENNKRRHFVVKPESVKLEG